MGTILGIFDSDLKYSSQLMNYIKRKHKNINQVRIFTNKVILYDFLSDNKIDVLLISQDKNEEIIEHDNIDNICILSEGGRIFEVDDSKDKKVIYKFQSAEQIIYEVFSYYPELNKNYNINDINKVKIISIFTLNEHLAKDNFSFNLANQYGVDKKTLLIDLNLLHGRSQIANINSENNLSEFLYFLKSQPTNIIIKMKSQVEKLGNFEYLNGVKFGPDLYNLSSSDFEFWIQELQASDYEIIVFNIGCYMESILDVLRKSKEILLILKKDLWNMNLYNNLTDQLNWTGYDDVVNKVQVVEVANEIIQSNMDNEVNNIFDGKWGDFAKIYAGDN